MLLVPFVVFGLGGCSEQEAGTPPAEAAANKPAAEAAPSNEAPKAQAAEAAPAAKAVAAKGAEPATAKPAEVAAAPAGQPAPAAGAAPAAAGAAPAAAPTPAEPELGDDGQPIVKVETLAGAKLKIDEMAQEMTKLITALRVAGKDKAKIDKLNADFETKNKRLTKEIEGIQQRLSPEDLAQFEGYAKQKIAPLAQLLIQAYFQASGMNASFEGQ